MVVSIFAGSFLFIEILFVINIRTTIITNQVHHTTIPTNMRRIIPINLTIPIPIPFIINYLKLIRMIIY